MYNVILCGSRDVVCFVRPSVAVSLVWVERVTFSGTMATTSRNEVAPAYMWRSPPTYHFLEGPRTVQGILYNNLDIERTACHLAVNICPILDIANTAFTSIVDGKGASYSIS